MGWAARSNPRVKERWRTHRLRRLVRLLPREKVEEAMTQMSERDRVIVQRTLDAEQPVVMH